MATATSPIIPELPIMRAQGEGEQRATCFELFFDLVYVFAVTQLSHHLLMHLDWSGAAQTAFVHHGGRGDDVHHGGRGNDTLRGGRGDDIHRGGAGEGDCRGGRGSDSRNHC